MSLLRTLSAIAALSVPMSAMAETYYEPTPPQAHLGIQATPKSPWITTNSGALQGEHLNIRGKAGDSFGSDWWGGGYNADYQLWDWENGSNSSVVGGMSLRVKAKLFFSEKEVARVRVGAHNLGSNVTNGSVVVNGKTVKNWHLTDQALREGYVKSTTFFDKTFDIAVGPFSVGFKAKAIGSVSLTPNVEMKNMRLTLSATPATRVNVTGSAGLDAWLASAKVEGHISPLVKASLPAETYLQIRPVGAPCWDADVNLDLLTMKGKFVLVVDYLVDTWRKTIAQWAGHSDRFELLNVGQPCVGRIVLPPVGGIKRP